MIMYEQQTPKTPPSSPHASTPLSTPPPPSPVGQTSEKTDALENKRLALEGARKAYENVTANPKAMNQMLRSYEAKVRKAEQAYEEAKAA